MEGGIRANEEQQWEQWRHNLAHYRQSELQIDIAHIPSRCDLEVACRSVAPGKASGLDGIPSELCRYHPC